MSIKDRLMEQTLVYRLWMAPFAEAKFAPVARHTDLSGDLSVLDVGCGPGTNARHFRGCDYLGIDINPKYIESARRRHPCRFMVGDVTDVSSLPRSSFDLVLVNSFLHHVPRDEAIRVLRALEGLLADDGELDVVELVMPDARGIPRWLAGADRGHYAKPLEEWREIFELVLEPVVVEPFALKAAGVALWEMVYFKGKRRPASDGGRGDRPPSDPRRGGE